jgi:hypothetical protein
MNHEQPAEHPKTWPKHQSQIYAVFILPVSQKLGALFITGNFGSSRIFPIFSTAFLYTFDNLYKTCA